MDDSLVRHRPKSTLLPEFVPPAAARPTVVERPVATGADPEDFASLPPPGSAYDAAYARASNKPVATLRFIIGDTVRGLPNANLDSIDWQAPATPGAAPAIVLRYTGLVPREVIIRGRNHLLKLYDLLADHRVAWVRELPEGKDFLDQGRTVVTGITVKHITETPP